MIKTSDVTEAAVPSGPASPRYTRRRTTLFVTAGILGLIAIIACVSYFSTRAVYLRVAVGPHNSDDVKIIQAMAQAFTREKREVRIRPVITDGAIASSAALSAGTVDLAVIRGDLAIPRDAQAVATLRKNVAVLWSFQPRNASRKTASGTITKISQLPGHRIGVIGQSQANVKLLEVILTQYGLDLQRVTVLNILPSDVAEAARNRTVDVFLSAGAVNGRLNFEAVQTVSREFQPIFLAIDTADAIAARHPAFEASEIPAGAFGGSPDRPEEAVKTIRFAQHLVADKDVSESDIAALTRQIFTARQSLIMDQPLAANIEAPDTDKDAVVPVHPGAAAYVDGEERSFMDRYSDYIWWTLMGLSGVGSLGAWFATYVRKDERDTNTHRRGRLLDMITLARRSMLMTELDELQQEADDILRSTLVCFDHGAIDESSLTTFNIALEQFHNAVADRKALLLDADTVQLCAPLPRAVLNG